jgi:L,D-peptidoglycan transpeptidase YkuD (ErfK/YbiS/YcfS/YnhG family)
VKALFFLLFFFSFVKADFSLPESTSQAIVGIADSWEDSHVSLGMYVKKDGKWVLDGKFWKGRLGNSGLAWGLGMSPPLGEQLKKEGDGKSPAGVFKLGGAYGYAKTINKHDKLPYTIVTSHDLWVEDCHSPFYNRHLRLKHEPSSEWEKQQQMRQNDPAHALKLYIGHNTASETVKARPFYGSSIFFHVWRSEGTKPSSGCTTMSMDSLQEMIRRVDPSKNPVYILLPRAEYLSLRTNWKLP